ncbi:hypothetical protein [Flavobacterium sp. W21_SRS_FM6]|uniref:hypothetical protein n=1 Tax=Flavobacterium sp. W21_SRS_FM6 TaxID=3240268 RepID=UPI003F8E7ECC
MTKRLSFVFVVVFGLSACELLPHKQPTENEHNQVNGEAENQELLSFCVARAETSQIEHNCNIPFWLNYRSELETLTWLQRKAEIERLDAAPNSLLKKILLSQGKETPYNDRLRAQRWIEILLPELSEEMQQFVKVMVYQPSQDLLELESALVTLGRVNSNLSQANEEQKLMIEKQKNQIEQLLKIEASIMANDNGDQL